MEAALPRNAWGRTCIAARARPRASMDPKPSARAPDGNRPLARRYLDGLRELLAHPATMGEMSSDQAVAAVLEGLVGLLDLDFAGVQLAHPTSSGVARIVRPPEWPTDPQRLEPLELALGRWIRRGGGAERFELDDPERGRKTVVVVPLGFAEEVGVLAAGAGRTGFPSPDEKLLLQVAADHVAVRLQEARRLAERHEAACRFERAADQRAAELAALAEALQKEHGLRQRAHSQRMLLAGLVENSDDFIGLATIRAAPMFVNRAGRRLTGQSENGRLCDNVRDYVAPRDRERLQRAIWPVVLSRGAWTGEIHFLNAKTGDEIPMHAHVFQVLPEGARGLPFVGTISRDITAIKQAQEENAASRTRYETLTPRQREVLEPLVRGQLNKSIAAELGISEVTVKVHRRQIMEKMGAASLAELVRMMERLRQPPATAAQVR